MTLELGPGSHVCQHPAPALATSTQWTHKRDSLEFINLYLIHLRHNHRLFKKRNAEIIESNHSSSNTQGKCTRDFPGAGPNSACFPLRFPLDVWPFLGKKRKKIAEMPPFSPAGTWPLVRRKQNVSCLFECKKEWPHPERKQEMGYISAQSCSWSREHATAIVPGEHTVSWLSVTHPWSTQAQRHSSATTKPKERNVHFCHPAQPGQEVSQTWRVELCLSYSLGISNMQRLLYFCSSSFLVRTCSRRFCSCCCCCSGLTPMPGMELISFLISWNLFLSSFSTWWTSWLSLSMLQRENRDTVNSPIENAVISNATRV